MIPETDASQFWQQVAKAKTILLAAHLGPDGDTLGTMLGLKYLIKANYPHVEVLDTTVSGPIAKLYSFMPGVDEIKNAEDPSLFLKQYDLAVCVDCGALGRLGKAADWFATATVSVNIDHHYSNERYATLNIIDDRAGASGEVLLDLANIQQLNLTADAATNIYVAILTDTGGFKYSSTSSHIFEQCSQLVDAGAKPEWIYRKIYEECPKSQLMLHANTLQKATFEMDDKLAWVIVTPEMFAAVNAADDHIEGMVEVLRRIVPVQVACIMRTTKTGGTKVSLRSDTEAINVASILETFGGGGHRMAAGVVVPEPPETFKDKLLPMLRSAIEQAVKVVS